MGETGEESEVGELSLLEKFVLQRGDARTLKDYWKTGEGGRAIRWGTDGDLRRCHRLVSREVPATDMDSDDVWGYCQNLHQELFGRPNPRD
jgi:hypothetical protein